MHEQKRIAVVLNSARNKSAVMSVSDGNLLSRRKPTVSPLHASDTSESDYRSINRKRRKGNFLYTSCKLYSLRDRAKGKLYRYVFSNAEMADCSLPPLVIDRHRVATSIPNDGNEKDCMRRGRAAHVVQHPTNWWMRHGQD